jgi:pyridoxamine 5'-phosphate oxidase
LDHRPAACAGRQRRQRALVARTDSISTPPSVLSEETADPDPFKQFAAWFDDAVAAGELLPEAMTLATATPSGEPSARMVLLRGFDERGFGFFTNFNSQKGRELAENRQAALVLYWGRLGRQVRISGAVTKQSADESNVYFQNRPRASQISAWASGQSEVIENRDVLEAAAVALDRQYAGGPVPLPPFWGGYRVIPKTIEFWVHRDNRLHDRLRYAKRSDGSWNMERLAP